jgi:hypothetical protein
VTTHVDDDGFSDEPPYAQNNCYYLVRGQTAFCGAGGPGHTTNASSERPRRDTEIAVDANTCP